MNTLLLDHGADSMNAHPGDVHRTYRIAVRGRLDESWSDWLSGMSVSIEGAEEGVPITVLTGPVVDQPALRGILNRLWDLNLILISVNTVSASNSGEEENR